MQEIDLSRFSELLDKPGTGVGRDGALNAITGPRLGDQADMSETDEQTNGTNAASSADNDDVQDDDSDTEERVPKSRFRKTREELISLRRERELERELDRERIQRLESELASVRGARGSADTGAMPTWWRDRWGDSEESQASWETYHRTMEEERAWLREELRNEQVAERTYRQQVEEDVSNSFDDQLEDLQESLGRELTDKQAAQLLDIVEEYSPVNEDGEFESFMPLDKAYEIYELRQSKNKNVRKEELARISSQTSQGDTSNTSGQRSGPPQWGDWRRRLGG